MAVPMSLPRFFASQRLAKPVNPRLDVRLAAPMAVGLDAMIAR